MKKLLNTLYVTTQGAYLCHEGESVLVRVEKETRLRVPIHMLGGIVCFGQVACSQPLMGLCGQRDVLISFLSEQGKFLARVHGPVSGNVLLRRRQYRIADSPADALGLARTFVVGKVANSRTVLQRALRDHECPDGRGDMEAVGLDPQVGYLHAERPGRPSLALDLIEEFRAFIGDRLALSLVNLKQIQATDFKTTESGAVSMSDGARKTLLAAYQKRKQEEIVHPFLGEKVQVGLLPHLQALLLARHIRGDLDGYPPFIWK
jgi:CRISPR-associated protein Cas1